MTREDNVTARALYDKVAAFHGFVRYDHPLAWPGPPAPTIASPRPTDPAPPDGSRPARRIPRRGTVPGNWGASGALSHVRVVQAMNFRAPEGLSLL
jgi:hypothetical protein